QADDLAGTDVEVGAVQRADVAEAARDCARLQQCGHAVPSCSVVVGVRCGGHVVPGRQTSSRTPPSMCQSPHAAGTTTVWPRSTSTRVLCAAVSAPAPDSTTATANPAGTWT